ncbi:antitoxin VbhA family protein [Clostridium paridis]|uniref:Antitoxin VbhA family protein n=1 Tax=Clostridium paridis TaxID=2803863 RepID=A0A937FD90_9CLOT|nr:antitoxin VbhA family protein [Clostridium paridis]MBL4930670.1 antitoxin VbhA family protein [Clostridium paridis]
MVKELSDERIEEILKNSRASVEMENLTPSIESEEVTKKCLRGEISNDEAKKQILKLHSIGTKAFID